jgi:hypothetical protein
LLCWSGKCLCLFFLKHWFHLILGGAPPNVALESNFKWKLYHSVKKAILLHNRIWICYFFIWNMILLVTDV